MSPITQLRTVLLLSAASLAVGCATEPEIDPADLPPEAMIDDGIDYYSSESDTGAYDYESTDSEELLSYNRDQWSVDEDGNKIYHLNQLPRGQASRYYVGDIRFVYANSTNGTGNGIGPSNTPVVVSRSGWPLHSDTIRGSHANTYYQTRRGRITYLPTTRYRNVAPTNTTQGTTTSGNSGSTSSGNTSSGSSPSVSPPRPSTTTRPPRPPRRSSPPPVSRPERSTRQTDNSRRPDR